MPHSGPREREVPQMTHLTDSCRSTTENVCVGVWLTTEDYGMWVGMSTKRKMVCKWVWSTTGYMACD